MFPDRRRTRSLLLFSAVAIAAAACGDRTQLTSTLNPGDASRAAAAPQSGAKIKVKTLQLSSNTLSIDGPAVSGNVSLANSGSPIDGVSIRGQIVQGSATQQAMLMPLNCAGTPATLQGGSCDMTFNASVSSSATGTGTLAPGSAVFVLDVIQTVGSTVTVLATKSLTVNLVAPAAISSLTLNSTTLAIDGPSVGWTATLSNPGVIQKDVFMQGVIIQGSTQKGAGGATVTCGAAIGVLPPGTCTFSFTVTAANAAGGPGTLVPGAATFQLQLLESDGTTTTVLDTRIVAIVLVPNNRSTITSVVATPQNFAINGPSTTVTVVLNNSTGAPVSGLRLAETLMQDPTQRAAGGAPLSCGSGDGVLPTGDCTMTLPASASNSATGSGMLTANLAFLNVDLVQSTGSGDLTLDTKSYAVGLLPPPTPTITAVTLGSPYVVLNGGSASYSVSLGNQNINSFSNTILELAIVQGGNAPVNVGGGSVSCGAGTGVVPTGTCNTSGTFSASNSGTTLVAGSATLQVKLIQFSESFPTFDTKTVPITIVPNTPSIVSLQLQSTTITIGSFTNYTVTVYNPTASTLTIAFVQGEMLQGSTDRAAAGTNVTCAGSGDLPPGACTFQFIAVASNDAGGSGTLVAGGATFQLTFSVFNQSTNTTTTYDVKSVAVTLVNP
jgi:hypothetical protein